MSRLPPLRSLPLRGVLSLSVLSVFTLLMVVVVVNEFIQFTRMVDAEAMGSTRTVMARLQRQVTAALASGDVVSAEREITALGVRREIDTVVAVDDQGQVLYATRFAWKGRQAAEVVPAFNPGEMDAVRGSLSPRVLKADDGLHLLAYFPLSLPRSDDSLRSRRVGGLFLRQTLHDRYDEVKRIVVVEGSVIWFAGVVAMGLLLLLLKRYVAEPLGRLAKASHQLAHGDAAVELQVRGKGEVAELARAFNESGQTIRRTVAELRDREEKYRTIVDNAGLGILLIDTDLRVIEANQVSRLWFPRLSAIGGQYRELMGLDNADDACTFCQVEETLRDGEHRETVTRVEQHGVQRYLRMVLSPVASSRGDTTSCVVILEEITERVASEKELNRVGRALRALSSANGAVVRAHRLEDLLRSICTTLVDVEGYRMAWIGRAEYDEQRRVTPLAHAGFEDGYLQEMRFSWNDDQYGRGPVGISIREARTCLLNNILSDPDFAPWRAAALAHGYASLVSFPLRVDGEVWGALAVYAPEQDAFDERELALLTELAETLAYGIESLRIRVSLESSEAALRQLNAELEQRINARTHELQLANRELEAFTYSVSHDLRAPLRGIDGFSKVLVDKLADQLDPESLHYLERVRKASQRMGLLIDDLLGLSRINRQEMTLETVDISALVRQILAELAEREPGRKVETVVEEGVSLHCDSRLVRVMLENLLGNAWKYTGKVSSPRIEFGQQQNDDEGICFVRDNGAGFDMRYADKLFVPFQRLHRMDEFEGTGIGLATVQRIVQRHQGRILAESAPGNGAVFYFTLRAAATADARMTEE